MTSTTIPASMKLPDNRVSNLIYCLGGRTAFVERAKKHGINLSISTLGSWITRNSLPSKHIPTCNMIASDLGTPINWQKFFATNPLTE